MRLCKLAKPLAIALLLSGLAALWTLAVPASRTTAQSGPIVLDGDGDDWDPAWQVAIDPLDVTLTGSGNHPHDAPHYARSGYDAIGLGAHYDSAGGHWYFRIDVDGRMADSDSRTGTPAELGVGTHGADSEPLGVIDDPGIARAEAYRLRIRCAPGGATCEARLAGIETPDLLPDVLHATTGDLAGQAIYAETVPGVVEWRFDRAAIIPAGTACSELWLGAQMGSNADLVSEDDVPAVLLVALDHAPRCPLAPIVVGEDAAFALDYTVPAAAALEVHDVVLTASVPPGTTFVTASHGGSESGGVVTWHLGDLAPGAAGQVTFTVHVDVAAFYLTVNSEMRCAEGLRQQGAVVCPLGGPGGPLWSGTVHLRTPSGPGVPGIAVHVLGRYRRYGRSHAIARGVPAGTTDVWWRVYAHDGTPRYPTGLPGYELAYDGVLNEWHHAIVQEPGSYQARAIARTATWDLYVSSLVEWGLSGGEADHHVPFDAWTYVLTWPDPLDPQPPQPFNDPVTDYAIATATANASGYWHWPGYDNAAAWQPPDPLFREWDALVFSDAPLSPPWIVVPGQIAGPGTPPGSGVDETTIRYPGTPPVGGSYPLNDYVVGSTSPPALTLVRDYPYLVWHAPQVGQPTQVLRGDLTQERLPLAGEQIRVAVTAPGGGTTTYFATTGADGGYVLDASLAGDAEFGTTKIGTWSATAAWLGPPTASAGPVSWQVSWSIIHGTE